MYPAYLDATFVILTLGLFTLAVSAVKRAARAGVVSSAARRWVALGGGGWLVLTGVLAQQGYLADFGAMPPRFGLAVVPAFVAMLVLGFSPFAARLAVWLPHHAILYAQSFRIAMEWILWDLTLHGAMPRVMSFEGRNFDLLTGVSALALAVLWQRGVLRSPALLRVWNWGGIGILTLTVSQGVLSTPTRFQVLTDDVPNTLVGLFPFLWLPAFVVPFAFLLHILSLRKLAAAAA